jgi:hypothetical protein
LNQPITEYQVSYAVKEWLLEHKWDVIAYNPPGSQGTFTIPNPSKDSSYRGQTGSESPDIVAVNGNNILVVEAKPKVNVNDANKLKALSENNPKLEIFQELILKVCKANQIAVPESMKFHWATATADGPLGIDWLGHIKISTNQPMNMSNLKADVDYYSYFVCELTAAKVWDSEFIKLF